MVESEIFLVTVILENDFFHVGTENFLNNLSYDFKVKMNRCLNAWSLICLYYCEIM